MRVSPFHLRISFGQQQSRLLILIKNNTNVTIIIVYLHYRNVWLSLRHWSSYPMILNLLFLIRFLSVHLFFSFGLTFLYVNLRIRLDAYNKHVFNVTDKSIHAYVVETEERRSSTIVARQTTNISFSRRPTVCMLEPYGFRSRSRNMIFCLCSSERM